MWKLRLVVCVVLFSVVSVPVIAKEQKGLPSPVIYIEPKIVGSASETEATTRADRVRQAIAQKHVPVQVSSDRSMARYLLRLWAVEVTGCARMDWVDVPGVPSAKALVCAEPGNSWTRISRVDLVDMSERQETIWFYEVPTKPSWPADVAKSLKQFLDGHHEHTSSVDSALQALSAKCKPFLGKSYSEWPDECAEVSEGFRHWKAQQPKSGPPTNK